MAEISTSQGPGGAEVPDSRAPVPVSAGRQWATEQINVEIVPAAGAKPGAGVEDAERQDRAALLPQGTCVYTFI